MKKNLATVMLFVVFIVGLSVLLYPAVSDYVNSKTQSRAVADYEQALAAVDETDYETALAVAEDYNRRLLAEPMAFFDPSLLSGYETALDMTGTGIMGYVTIEKLGVELPIYHGTGEGVLSVAVGHLEGSSLPVGGESTHCVLSAHRGLPSARLFTDLDELELGDSFTVSVLDRVLTYRVDQLLVVEPDRTDALQIVEGMDYCTLLTCTPYGVNTHRLLVRGVRVENAESAADDGQPVVAGEAERIDPLLVAPAAAAPMLLLLLIWLLIRYRGRKGMAT